jgi:hypothetical protein
LRLLINAVGQRIAILADSHCEGIKIAVIASTIRHKAKVPNSISIPLNCIKRNFVAGFWSEAVILIHRQTTVAPIAVRTVMVRIPDGA